MYSVIFYHETMPLASMRHKLFKEFNKEELTKQMADLAHHWDNFFSPGFDALQKEKARGPKNDYVFTVFRLPDNSIVLFEWFK